MDGYGGEWFGDCVVLDGLGIIWKRKVWGLCRLDGLVLFGRGRFGDCVDWMV